MSNKLSGLNYSNYESNRITRESIQEAFIYLLSKKPIKEISITEIVEKAGVSRGAYYKNYTSKEEILLDFSKNVFTIIQECLDNEEYISNPQKWFYLLFEKLKPNEKLLKLFVRTNVRPTFKFTSPSFEKSLNNEQMYELKYFEHGLSAIITKWINDGLVESPLEMSLLCSRLFKGLSIIFKYNEEKE